ncbi:MAG: T9SS type A sorting domain-containing protein [Ignavibacteria bacterium]
MKKILLLSVFLFMIFSQFANSQQKWSKDRRLTSKPPIGDFQMLPSDFTQWENPNKSDWIINTPIGQVLVTPNVRVLPNSNQQDEVILVRHPTNPMIMFGSANTTAGSSFGQGSYTTTDGGITWFGTDLIPAFGSPSDPGPCIDKDGVIIITTLNPGMAASYSTNNGITWSPAVNITTQSSDKNFAASDDAPSSSFYGRSYCVWSNFASGSPPIVISYTTNSGVSWSSVNQINTSVAGHYSQGCDIAIGPTGEVYVCWAAPNSASPFIEDFAGFAKSVNGSANWTVTDNAYDMNGIRSSSYNGWGVRVNSFPRIGVDRSGGPRNGWIYIVASDVNLAPAGSDADVVIHRSSDGGVTWSSGVRVNQDPLNNGKVQFFPAIRVDESGGVNVVYYDNRNYPSVGDSCQVYVSRSLDGGTTWTDMLVSDHSWKVKGEAGLGNYMGDYIGITSGSGKLWPFWFDDKSGTMQAWTTSVQITTFPLNAFNLTSPPAGSRIATLPNNNTNYTFNWDTSASTASYKWIFGSPNATSRQITLLPNGNSLSVTGGQLDAILQGLGLNQGDSLVGQWDVWAFRNDQTNDSMKATNGPRSITLKRAKPLLTAFNLVSPPNNSSILTQVSNTTPVNINWTRSGEAVNYRWLYASPDFSNQSNVKLRFAANNNGFDSSLTLRNSQIDSALAGLGINLGDSTVGQWRTYGYSAGDSLSSAQTYNITFRRGIPPTVTTSLDSIIVNVFLGGGDSRNINIGNTGQFPLIWSISESSATLDNLKTENNFTQEQIEQMVNLPKGSADLFYGHEQTDAQGGPDAGGYSWIDSDEPGGPVFNWVEISSTGTEITTWTIGTADDGSVILPLPFTFNYYNNNYNSLKVCTNGWAGFDIASTSNAYSNVSIPVAAEPNNSLYPFWDDLDLRTSGHVYYMNDPANNRFIVEYKDAPHFTSGELYTFQLIIYNDGRIYYQYLNMDSSLLNSCTIGTENSAGSVGLQVVYNAAYLHNNLAIKIEKGLSWLEEIPSSGTITPGGNQNVNVIFYSAGLSIGTYSGIMKINSNDPINPVKNILVRMNVGPVSVQNIALGIPDEFKLDQNFPNPFNPSTKINFAIPKQGFVDLKIYDILGKEVAALISEVKSPGYYEVDFNAGNLSSGVYFYRLESSGFINIKRMLLVK